MAAQDKKLILMGLVEPTGVDAVEAFNQWYLGNHVEDTYNCPQISAVRSFRAVKGFLGDAPAQYLTIYEFIGSDADSAEKALAEYQSDPNGWDQRQPNNNSMSVVGAGWYEEAIAFGTD